tara:strand:- start:1815 stop:2921 length:1107 start_codon:yes stop_codon:yes gene_type:complete
MDPFLAQGFSNLTRALIGDPETDYQVARTNLTQAQMGTEEARRVLLEAQTLTENELRDPRKQVEIAKAQETLANTGKLNAQTETINALRPSQIESEENLAKSRLADSMLTQSRRITENALRQPQVNSENALAEQRRAAAGADTSRGGFYDAQIETENQTRQGKVNKLDAETAKLESEQQLNRAKTASENRIILNAGQTIRTTNAQGRVETYTAPETVEVKLEPGEEAVVSKADGTKETFAHSQKASPDPKDAKGRLELIDAEIKGAVESGLFADVPSAVMRRIQSNFTTAAENRDVEDVLRLMRNQLSETYRGQTAVTITEGFNFDVPAYIINFLMQPNANLDPNIITKTYGFSLDQANKIIRFVRAQ